MNKVVIGTIIATIVIIIGGAYFMTRSPQSSDTGIPGQPVSITVTDTDWITGNPDAKVTLVEYSDFQCPACAGAETAIRSLLEQYPNDIAFVYRHFPLRSVHPNAQLAAQAAEAAGLQGKFWDMHHLLFDNQTAWAELGNPTDTFVGYAQSLELDTDKFTSDLTSGDVEAAVNAQAQSGIAFVTGTPTFILNGTKLNLTSLNQLSLLVQTAIAQNSQSAPNDEATPSAQTNPSP